MRESQKARLAELLREERRAWRDGIEYLAGVDEAGLGPLAGPVVAAAVIMPAGDEGIEGVDDSKVLSRAQRERLALAIRAKAVAIGLGVVDAQEIDRMNIYRAGLEAMRLAVERLRVRPEHVFADGRTIPGMSISQTRIVGGDARVYSIAAASIIAKVHRDAIMRRLDSVYPGYGFARHVGYGTRAHLEALRTLGPCPCHRRTFAPVREALGAGRLEGAKTGG